MKCFMVLCMSLVWSVSARDIPDYIHVCRRSDPQLAKCVRESVEALKPHLKSGIPEINVPSLEPLLIPEVHVFGNDKNFRATLRNVEVYQASNFEITKMKLNLDRHTYRVSVKFPKLEIRGDYDIDAKIIVAFKGTGTFTSELSDVDGQGVLKAEIVERNGHREMKFTSFDFKIKVGGLHLKIENLFNGDKILTQAAHDVIHDNQEEFLKAILPYLQERTSEILLEAANKITDGLDYDKVLPEN